MSKKSNNNNDSTASWWEATCRENGWKVKSPSSSSDKPSIQDDGNFGDYTEGGNLTEKERRAAWKDLQRRASDRVKRSIENYGDYKRHQDNFRYLRANGGFSGTFDDYLREQPDWEYSHPESVEASYTGEPQYTLHGTYVEVSMPDGTSKVISYGEYEDML